MVYDRARQKSRTAIKSAMLALMREKPLGSITVTQLCGRCCLNRSTFYSYYPTIDHLIREMHGDLFLQMEADLHISPENYGLRDKAQFTGFLVHVCREDERFRLFLSSGPANLFAQNMVEHFLSRFCPEDASAARRNQMLYHMVGAFTLLCRWIHDGFPQPPEELAEQIIGFSQSAIQQEVG